MFAVARHYSANVATVVEYHAVRLPMKLDPDDLRTTAPILEWWQHRFHPEYGDPSEWKHEVKESEEPHRFGLKSVDRPSGYHVLAAGIQTLERARSIANTVSVAAVRAWRAGLDRREPAAMILDDSDWAASAALKRHSQRVHDHSCRPILHVRDTPRSKIGDLSSEFCLTSGIDRHILVSVRLETNHHRTEGGIVTVMPNATAEKTRNIRKVSVYLDQDIAERMFSEKNRGQSLSETANQAIARYFEEIDIDSPRKNLKR